MAVLDGQRMELECKTNDNERVNRWTAARVGQRVEVIFRANILGEQVDNPAIRMKFPYFGVDYRQIGDIVLYSNRTELTDAGVYVCYKNQDSIKTSAQLTVLGKYYLKL